MSDNSQDKMIYNLHLQKPFKTFEKFLTSMRVLPKVWMWENVSFSEKVMGNCENCILVTWN